ncbi:hypothetical protein M0R72_14875 [Candidatus Pacearchaeota archaeon]|jgi:hypothetical protein|nr:hypothetical protein [Candidatus Pacearchaeota archaeon]
MIDMSNYPKVQFWTSGPGATSHRTGWKICDIPKGESILGCLPKEIVDEIRTGSIRRKKGIQETSLVNRVAIVEEKMTGRGHMMFFPIPGNVGKVI